MVLIESTAILVPLGGQYLAVSRKNDQTKWCIPGGKVDPGESNVEAAVRELREETGLCVAQADLVPLWTSRDGQFWATGYICLAAVDLSQLRPETGSGVLWTTRNALMDPQLNPFATWTALVFASLDQYRV